MDGRDRQDGGDWAPQLGEEPDERHRVYALSKRNDIDDLLAGRPDLVNECHLADQAFGDMLAACSFAGLDRTPHHEREGGEPSFWPPELVVQDETTGLFILNNPRGARFGRLCFSPAIQKAVTERYAEFGFHRLPTTHEEIVAFLQARTCITPLPEDFDTGGNPDAALRRVGGFDLDDVAKQLLAIRGKDPISYLLLMSLEFTLALKRMPEIQEQKAPFDRLQRGFLDALLILAEFERLADILRELARLLYRKLPKGAEDRLSALKMLKEMTPEKIKQLANEGNSAARFLRNNGFHAEVLYRYVFRKPAGISPRDPVANYLAGCIDHDFYEAIADPATLAHRRKALERSAIISRGKVYRDKIRQAGKHEAEAREQRSRPSRPVDYFFGMDLITTAAVGVLEIFLDPRKVRARENEDGNIPLDLQYLPQPQPAHWTLVQALLAGTSKGMVAYVANLAKRGRPPADPELDRSRATRAFALRNGRSATIFRLPRSRDRPADLIEPAG